MRTVTYLIIGIVVVSLATGFVYNIFAQANTLPELIDVDLLPTKPTRDQPLVVTPREVTVESGDAAQLLAGYFNTESTGHFRVKTGTCIDTQGNTFQPASTGLHTEIPTGKARGYKIFVVATDTVTNAPLVEKKYLCELVAFETTELGGCALFPGGVCPMRHRIQFTLTVT